MSKTFDLSTLNLSAGTHTITVKARASGYADSPASNAVSYVVAGDTEKTINFTIRCYNRVDGITQEPQSQTIKSGSTWREWVDSTNFKIFGSPPVINGLLKITNGGSYTLYNGYSPNHNSLVIADDLIIANGEYEFYSTEPS